MGIRRLLGRTTVTPRPTSIVMHAGEPAECISICHQDGSISEVRVSADNDELNIQVNPAWHHAPHLSGGYV